MFTKERPFAQDTYSLIKNKLNELLHVVKDFDGCINDIYSFWLDHKGRYIGTYYTGWNIVYEHNKMKCINVNDENLYIPIFINFIADRTDTNIASTPERVLDVNDNVAIITYNNSWGSMYVFKSKLKHEFLHIREQYANKYKNVISNSRNKASENIVNIFNINKSYLDDIRNILYFISPTELHARINEFAEFIKDKDIEYIKNTITLPYKSMYDLYYDILIHENLITLIKSFLETYDNIVNNKLLHVLGYYLNEKNLLKVEGKSINNKNKVDTFIKYQFKEYIHKLITVMDNVWDTSGLRDKIYDLQFN